VASTSSDGQKLNITVAPLDSLLIHLTKAETPTLPPILQDLTALKDIRTVEIPIMGYSSIVMSDNANVRDDQANVSVSFIIFSSRTNASYKKGRPVQFLRFQLPSKDSFDEFPFIHTTTASFNLPYNENSDLAFVASSGHRALWMQTPSDRDMAKIIKFGYNPSLDPDVSLGVLLPPAPLLPFQPSNCTALTFDEGSGMIGFGLFNNSVYTLSL
jgi:hypothetical protein